MVGLTHWKGTLHGIVWPIKIRRKMFSTFIKKQKHELLKTSRETIRRF